MLDLRLPIGWFFTITGVLLLAMGFFAPETRAALTAVNVDLILRSLHDDLRSHPPAARCPGGPPLLMTVAFGSFFTLPMECGFFARRAVSI